MPISAYQVKETPVIEKLLFIEVVEPSTVGNCSSFLPLLELISVQL